MKPLLKKSLITVLAMMSLSTPVLAGPRPLRSTAPSSSSIEQQPKLTPKQKSILHRLERSPDYKKLTPDIRELVTKDPSMYKRYGPLSVLYRDEHIDVIMDSDGLIGQAKNSVNPETDELAPLKRVPYGTQSSLKIPTDEIKKLPPADQEYLMQGLIPALDDIYAYFYDVPFVTMSLQQIMDGEANGKYILPRILLRGDPVDSDEHPDKTAVFDLIGRPVYNLGDFVDLDKPYATGFCAWTNGHGWTETKKEKKKSVRFWVFHQTTPQTEERAKKIMEVIYEKQVVDIYNAIHDVQSGVKKIMSAKGIASITQPNLTPTQKITVDLTSQFSQNLENLTKLKAFELKNPNSPKVGSKIPLGFYGDATPETLRIAQNLEKSHKYPKKKVFFKDSDYSSDNLVYGGIPPAPGADVSIEAKKVTPKDTKNADSPFNYLTSLDTSSPEADVSIVGVGVGEPIAHQPHPPLVNINQGNERK